MYQSQVDVVVLAAGKGGRMQAGKNKIFLPLQKIPIIFHTLSRLNSMAVINKIFLVLREEEQEEMDRTFTTFGEIKKLAGIVQGGKERHNSVMNGLNAVAQENTDGCVMVHDGARPFITSELVSRLLDSSSREGIVVPALPIFETIRKKGDDQKVQRIERKNLYTMQTPQLFHSSAIERVFARAKGKVPKPTDEASFFEFQGEPVRFVEGERWNIKVTRQEDLDWAETLITGNNELKLHLR